MEKVLVKLVDNQAILIDGNNEIVLEKTSQDPKTKKWKYALPENSANRKWLDVELLTAKKTIVLDYKETRNLGPQTNRSKFEIEKYLDDNDLATYYLLQDQMSSLEQKARNKYNEQKTKTLSPIEKLKAKIAKYEEQIAKYEKEGK